MKYVRGSTPFAVANRLCRVDVLIQLRACIAYMHENRRMRFTAAVLLPFMQRRWTALKAGMRHCVR